LPDTPSCRFRPGLIHGNALLGQSSSSEMEYVVLTQRIARKILTSATMAAKLPRALASYLRYRKFTMIQPIIYIRNLLLCVHKAPASGCIIEAGVWRGGMSAGIANMLPGRVHYLFDL
jgi:hypothetical protein